MTFIIVLVIIVVLFRVLKPWIQQWMVRRMQRQAEDYLRRAAGFPPREEERRRGTGRRRAAPRSEYRTQSGGENLNMAGEMKRVAEDVEFVEYHEYSESVEINSRPDGSRTEVKVEQQVTDAEYVVISNKKGS